MHTPTNDQIIHLSEEYLLPTYTRFPVCLVAGKGCRATDANGKQYLDFTSGIGVNSLGWCDDEWVAAVSGQAATLQHTSNLFYTAPGAQLAAALCQATGMAKAFFANSGAEANEGAIKAARKYSREKYGEGRAVILSLQESFHGRTLATLSATGQDTFHQHFHPFPAGFRHVQPNDLQALQAALTPDVCAVLLEPIQGEGGVLPLDTAYLKSLEALCREKDILLIADEVQTGIGRTGTFLASELSGIQPDMVTLAKGLGGGLPIGALLLAKTCAGALGKGDHATTFGANPVVCAGALVVLRRLSPTFLADIAQKGAALKARLQTFPCVENVTGTGLMLGITFRGGFSAADVLGASMDKGLLCLLAKTKLRLLPPLTITPQEITEGVDILQNILEGLA